MRLIDLPEAMEGQDCILCLLGGFLRPACFLDRKCGPVCSAHFIALLQMERAGARTGRVAGDTQRGRVGLPDGAEESNRLLTDREVAEAFAEARRLLK